MYGMFAFITMILAAAYVMLQVSASVYADALIAIEEVMRTV